MNESNKVIILSSFARDVLLNKDGKTLREQKGGPAYFIQAVLKKENVNFGIPYRPMLKVKIIMTSKGEYGKIELSQKPIMVNWQSINEPMILISTILDEFDLENIKDYKGQIFIDVQGYVRDGKDFGKKKRWNINVNSIFCIKGTEEELSYLPKDVLEKQKRKMLLVTRGIKGSTLYFKNKVITARPATVIKSIDTIGAGDSFFAFFISMYLQSNNPKKSLEYATFKTASFLAMKSIPIVSNEKSIDILSQAKI